MILRRLGHFIKTPHKVLKLLFMGAECVHVLLIKTS
jgi:hypothetical protein